MDKDKKDKIEAAGWQVGSADDLLQSKKTTENGSSIIKGPFGDDCRYHIEVKREGRFIGNYYIWFDKRIGTPRVNVLNEGNVQGRIGIYGNEENFVLLELYELEKDNPKYKRVYR